MKKKILADGSAHPVSFYVGNFISNMEFQVFAEIDRILQVFRPIALEKFICKTRVYKHDCGNNVDGSNGLCDLQSQRCCTQRVKQGRVFISRF